MSEIKFEIIYNQSELPAPFAHIYQIKGTINGEKTELEFVVEYTDREGLTEDEIINEGFSPDDDYSWKGSLSPAWNKKIIEWFSNIRFKNIKDANITISYSDDKNNIKGTPENIEVFKYELEELIQAIYAQSGREIPFIIRYKNIVSDKAYYQLDLQADFIDRKIKISKHLNQEVSHGEIEWENLQKVLKKLYSVEFIYEEGFDKEPKTPGVYVDPGEGLWFKFNKGVKNPSKKDLLTVLKETFEEIIKE